MQHVSIDDLAAAIAQELEQYSQDVTDGLKKEVKQVAKECKQEIQQNSPIQTGSYKKGWKDQVAYEGHNDIRMVVRNKTDYQLTHLLEHGHAKVSGGRVDGHPHIGPAEQRAKAKLVAKIKEAMSR